MAHRALNICYAGISFMRQCIYNCANCLNINPSSFNGEMVKTLLKLDR